MILSDGAGQKREMRGFRKDRGTRDQIANNLCIIKKQESSRETSTSALLTTTKPLTVWITQTVENS